MKFNFPKSPAANDAPAVVTLPPPSRAPEADPRCTQPRRGPEFIDPAPAPVPAVGGAARANQTAPIREPDVDQWPDEWDDEAPQAQAVRGASSSIQAAGRTAMGGSASSIVGRGSATGIGVRPLLVQYFDGYEAWDPLEEMPGGRLLIGRAHFRHIRPVPTFLAEKHLWLVCEGRGIYAEPLDTLNGVYLRVPPHEPIELISGTRFQVGRHVIAFRLPPANAPAESRVSSSGETFLSRTLMPYAYLDFIGPDGVPGATFPITKPEETVIGRDGSHCDVALPGDNTASRPHARILGRDGSFYLEDLESRNGTFAQINGRLPLRCATLRNSEGGDELLLGRILIRVVDLNPKEP